MFKNKTHIYRLLYLYIIIIIFNNNLEISKHKLYSITIENKK